MRKFVSILGCVVWFGLTAAAQQPPTGPKTPEDLRREAAMAAFAQKQEAANWPEKFERIGKEMGVPGDVLAAIAFAETRWDHLTWPPGETVSPENGMPRPYGIMSLMDNDYFGHSLAEAAKLIGHTPDELKADPELNIRGAAAYLKKLYMDNPLPDGTTINDIESWQNAIMKYSGIPEDYLSYDHVFSCYVHMTQGYDEYGMHWKPHPVNLEPMRERRDKYMKAWDDQVKARIALTPEQLAAAPAAPTAAKPPPELIPPPAPAPAPIVTTMVAPKQSAPDLTWMIWALLGTAVLFVAWMFRPKKETKKP